MAEDPASVPALRAGRGAPMVVGGARAVRTGIARAAWMSATDVLSLLAMVFALPFVILAVGVPIALTLQVVLWLARLF